MKKTKQEKIYNKNNISALSRYLGVTTQTINFYKNNKPLKFDLLVRGWHSKCNEVLSAK